MKYAGDLVYDPDDTEALGTTLNHALAHGCVLGWRHTSLQVHAWGRGAVFGLYVPLALDQLLPPELPIDRTLTPRTANACGYRWIEDTRYDRSLGFVKMLEVLQRVWDGGYTLGSPASGHPKDVGVYTERSEAF